MNKKNCLRPIERRLIGRASDYSLTQLTAATHSIYAITPALKMTLQKKKKKKGL